MKEISKILREEWNPIGTNVPADEYQQYVPKIFELKNNNADLETIAIELDKIATGKMGLKSNIGHCREVAKKILAIN